jgi:hypothetical protein
LLYFNTELFSEDFSQTAKRLPQGLRLHYFLDLAKNKAFVKSSRIALPAKLCDISILRQK